MFFCCVVRIRKMRSLASLLSSNFRLFLAAVSPVFQKTFYGSLGEEKKINVINVYSDYYRNSGKNNKNKRLQLSCFQNVSRNCLHLLYSEVNKFSLFELIAIEAIISLL